MTVIGASLLMGLAVWIAMPSATRKQEAVSYTHLTLPTSDLV